MQSESRLRNTYSDILGADPADALLAAVERLDRTLNTPMPPAALYEATDFQPTRPFGNPTGREYIRVPGPKIGWSARAGMSLALGAALVGGAAYAGGLFGGSAERYPPPFMNVQSLSYARPEPTISTSSGYPVAQLSNPPAGLSKSGIAFVTRPDAPWTSCSPAGAGYFCLQYRLLSAVRYSGTSETAFVDVVQSSPVVRDAGVSLPGQPFALPDGSVAYLLEYDGSQGKAYVAQWTKGGYVIQVMIFGGASSDEARSLAANVTVQS